MMSTSSNVLHNTRSIVYSQERKVISREWRLDMRLKNRTMLRQYMEYKHMSVRDLAKAAGLSHSTVGHLRKGTRGGACSPDTARRVEDALGCPPGLLFEARASNVSRETGRSAA